MQREDQLHEKRVEAVFSQALRDHLAQRGFDPAMGARPMQRLIQDTIRRALADELLFGRLVSGGPVEVDLDDQGEVVVTFSETSTPQRSEERLVGKECVRTCRSRWSTDHVHKKRKTKNQ